jgi:aminomethyltransferase
VSEAPLRQTPIHARHEAAGGRMVPFAGYELPVLYASIFEEHRAVRERAGLFDVSHMGQLHLRGPDALRLAQTVFSNDVGSMTDGQVRYGLVCGADGGVIDDVTLYRVGPREAFLCVNAVNVAAVGAWLEEVRKARDSDCKLSDESADTGLLAVQGPRARELVHALAETTPRVRRWHFVGAELAGVPALLSRTGYTGEDGYEIYVTAERAGELWDALVAAGSEQLSLAGLGARDTLRTEMAYPLYGHELDLEHDPIEAGLERFVAFGRDFIGEEALARQRDRGPERRLVGLVLEGRQVARPGTPILGPDTAEAVGVVTSGTFAPTVERSIAIGYVPAALADDGTALAVEIRTRTIPCRVAPTPFFNRKANRNGA